jgi:hypothetical protein
MVLLPSVVAAVVGLIALDSLEDREVVAVLLLVAQEQQVKATAAVLGYTYPQATFPEVVVVVHSRRVKISILTEQVLLVTAATAVHLQLQEHQSRALEAVVAGRRSAVHTPVLVALEAVAVAGAMLPAMRQSPTRVVVVVEAGVAVVALVVAVSSFFDIDTSKVKIWHILLS